MGLCIFKKEVTIKKGMYSLMTGWEGRLSSNWIEVLNSFYSESHLLLALEKAVLSLLHVLSSLACLAAMIRGVRLQRVLAESKNRCCPKEKKTNEPRLSKLISSWSQALFLKTSERCRNRSEGTICTSSFMYLAITCSVPGILGS